LRSLLVVAAAALAACRSPQAPDVEGAGERKLASRLTPGADDALKRTALPCLFVSNHTKETVSVFVDGRHVGFVGPRSSAGFYVGRSAGARTVLKALSKSGHWQESTPGPAWHLTWHLHP
jgi:hypothetical protein